MRTLTVSNLTKAYGPVVAVEHLSFSARPGRVTGFLGPNGSGKTTTLRVLLGLARPTAGSATIGGVAYRDLAEPSRTVGAVIDNMGFHPSRSPAQHLRALASVGRMNERRVEEVLGLVGLADAAGRKLGGFSLRMRQRLNLAGALLGDPGTLVLDEPLNGLDPEGIRWVRDLIRRLAAQGRTVLLSSHLLAEVAHTVDDVVIISAGHLVTESALADIAPDGDDLEQTYFSLVNRQSQPNRQPEAISL
jgi:ABC-2 type transport system ATP-binding protein